MTGLPRVSPPRVSGAAVRAPRPPLAAAGSADAHRQTSFTLDADVELVVAGLGFEGQAAVASSAAKRRTHVLAAAMGQWSRSWLCRQQALHAIEWGNYAAALPLIRNAADYQAAEIYVLQTKAVEWEDWLGQGGIGLDFANHATEFRLHAFRAAEVLAAHEVLGPLYRVVLDLSMPHFGSTLLLAGNESNPERVAMTFGDRDFHLGLAELTLGWLLSLGSVQLATISERGDVFDVSDEEAVEAWHSAAAGILAREDRCRVEQVEREGERRYLVANWRRAAGAARKRIIL